MKKSTLSILIILFTVSGLGFNASLQKSNYSNSNLEYDILRNFSGFYSDFPDSYEERDSIGSFSFRDQSLKNPDYSLKFSGKYSQLSNRSLQLYYASKTGNTTVTLMNQPINTGNLSRKNGSVDVEISSFQSVYPGEIYAGFTRRKVSTETSTNSSNKTFRVEEGVFNLTKIQSTVMKGNYSVVPSIRRVEDSTVVEVDEVENENGDTIFNSKNPELIISVGKDNKIIEESVSSAGDKTVFNLSFSGGETVYVNGIAALRTKGVSGCETVSNNEFYYIVNESSFNEKTNDSGCFEVEDVNRTVIDFANTTIDGSTENQSFSEGCAVRVSNSTGVELKDPRVQQFERGICVSNSKNTLIKGEASQDNSMGIYLSNSTTDIKEINLKNKKSEIQAQNSSVANMTKVHFDTADITAVGEDINVRNVYNPPPDPGGSVNASQWINITSTDSSGNIKDLGFNYPPLSESNINPLFLYKFNLASASKSNNTTSRNWDFKNLSVVKKPSERTLLAPGVIDEFSIFGVYGERVEGNGTGNDPGEGAGDNEEGTGNQGGSPDPGSGQSTGGAGGGLTPEPNPEPTPIEVDLTLKEDSMSVQQGDTSQINFSVTNTGEVEAPGISVEAETRSGWESGRRDFRNIPTGQTVSGNILMDVFQNEITGNYTVPVEARRDGSTLDQELLNVEVLPRQRIRDVDVVESPTFLNLDSRSSEEIGFLLENSGDYNLENVSLDIRNAENCVREANGMHNLKQSERKNVKYDIRTKAQEQTCTGVFTFNSDESSEMAVKPVRIKISQPSIVERLTTNILPIILLIWTIFTVYWIRRRFYER